MKNNEKGIDHFRTRALVYQVGFILALFVAIITSIAFVGADGRREVLQAENEQLNATVVQLQERNMEAEVLRQNYCTQLLVTGEELAWQDAQTTVNGTEMTTTLQCGLMDGSTKEYTLRYDFGESIVDGPRIDPLVKPA